MISRRAFIGAGGAALVAMPRASRAQESAKPSRIGLLEAGAPAASQHFLDAFKRGLASTVTQRVARKLGPGSPGSPASGIRAFGERTNEEMRKQSDASARSLRVQLQYVEVQRRDQLDGAFSTMAKERVEGVIMFSSQLLFNERRRTVELAARHRLPVMSNAREFVELGRLMAYGASTTDLVRHSAMYVDKILKTAKALGLTIPPSLLQRADEIIQ